MMRTNFDARIESLRGLAAIAVVITHSAAIFRINGNPAYWNLPLLDQSPLGMATTLLGAIFNPGAAVVLFFVLSGYVLTLSLKRHASTQGTGAFFFVRRFFRLIPAMWASIFVYSVVTQSLAMREPNLFSIWFIVMFGPPPRGTADIISGFLLRDFRSNPVIWTMYVEVIGSAAMPILYSLHKRLGLGAGLLVTAALIAVSVTFPSSLTLRYLFCFDVGVLLALFPRLHISWALRNIIAALVLFAIERLFLLPQPELGLLIDALGSFILLSGLLGGGEGSPFALLRAALPRFIGRISYSLYLFHPPVLFVIGIGLSAVGYVEPWSNIAAMVLGILLSITVASVMYVAIETPAIRLGRTLTREAVISI